jgi:hypothetical protein
LRLLQTLDLRDAPVTDAGLEHLRGLAELEKLCFWVTDAGLEHLRGLPRLRELDLGGTKVTDAGLEHLKELRQLEKLDLYDTGITDAGLEHLKGLQQLQELGLSGTEVSDAGLEHLKGLRLLRTLDLSFTNVTGPLDPTERESHGPQLVGLDMDLVGRAAPTDAAVLIEGELGTGKALLAYQIHCRSSRAGGPFVRVACAALREANADDTLFGRPSRSGNAQDLASPGLLRSARGGTLFLDNVSHLPFSTQVRLFDAIQGGDCDRPPLPGGGRPDARVVASTREDLKTAVAENRFYSALYHFLNVVPVSMPPLRRRRRDARLMPQGGVLAASGHHACRGSLAGGEGGGQGNERAGSS